MKNRIPKSRNHLSIKRSDYVLEVGGGHNPHPRSNVIVDKYVDSNYHRSGNIIVNNHQKFIHADGEDLPFEDNEFDYVISNQVLEHVSDPSKFLDEQSRVAKRGFIETPSLIGEYLFPKESHSWVILNIENRLVIVDKQKIGLQSKVDFGDIFLHYLPKHSIAYKLLERTYPALMTVRYEWKDKIEYVINPSEELLKKYFTSKWDLSIAEEFLPKQKLTKELANTVIAFFDVINSYLKSRFSKIINKTDNRLKRSRHATI